MNELYTEPSSVANYAGDLLRCWGAKWLMSERFQWRGWGDVLHLSVSALVTIRSSDIPRCCLRAMQHSSNKTFPNAPWIELHFPIPRAGAHFVRVVVTASFGLLETFGALRSRLLEECSAPAEGDPVVHCNMPDLAERVISLHKKAAAGQERPGHRHRTRRARHRSLHCGVAGSTHWKRGSSQSDRCRWTRKN